ncbi:MAG: amidohydrolase family protein [Ginsengibacter sp.]
MTLRQLAMPVKLYCLIFYGWVLPCPAEYHAVAHRMITQGEVAVTTAGNYAKAGTTYVLANDITSTSSTIFLGKNVTLDLNGYTVKYGDGNYGHISNSGFEEGLNGWDLSKAPGAKLVNTADVHVFLGRKSMSLEAGDVITSSYVALPLANRSYFAMCGITGRFYHDMKVYPADEMKVSVYVEDERGNEKKVELDRNTVLNIIVPSKLNQRSVAPFYSMDDYYTVKKFDSHVHVNTDAPGFIEQAAEDNFRLLTINWDDVNDPPPMEVQQDFALKQLKVFPGRIAYATTFSIRKFNDPGWYEQTIAYLKNSFLQGAIAVKIYKVIGLSLKDLSGKLVMIDDARFDPVIDFIEKNNIPVVGHLAEPKNCWLPLEKMTIKGDKSYFSEHPEYHMYLHPEFPSYEQQIAARDHMLEKHPNLKFVGAHLGSLEWNVDELAKRLDKFPNMAVDMAARISHLEYQAKMDRKKVRDFCIKYQDRLLYATDLQVNGNESAPAIKKKLHGTWYNDWKFFTTDDMMRSAQFEGAFKGLQLPREVIDKIYRTNAEKWFPQRKVN